MGVNGSFMTDLLGVIEQALTVAPLVEAAVRVRVDVRAGLAHEVVARRVLGRERALHVADVAAAEVALELAFEATVDGLKVEIRDANELVHTSPNFGLVKGC